MLIPESLLMVLLVAIATYVACFKVNQAPGDTFVGWLPETTEDHEEVRLTARR